MVTQAVLEQRVSAYVGAPVTIVCETAAQVQAAADPNGAGFTVWGYVNITRTYLEDGTFTEVAEHVIRLRVRICNDLKRLNDKHNPNLKINSWESVNPNDQGYGPMADLEDGRAVETLYHEATHIKLSTTDEARVECTTYQYRTQAVKGWGIAKWKQDRLYWGFKLSHYMLPPEYLINC